MRRPSARCARAAACVGAALALTIAPASAQVRRLSVSMAGTEANGASRSPAISESGRVVVFVSAATNLDQGDTNGVDDLFVVDRDPDADGVFDEPGDPGARRVTTSALVQPNAAIDHPAVSADGRYVVFVTAASNLLTQFPEAPLAQQVYRLDRLSQEIRRVSVGVTLGAANADCAHPVVSADGRYVAFTSVATNLTTSDPGEGGAVFLADLVTGALAQVSPPLPQPGPPPPPQPSSVRQVVGRVAIDPAGRRLAYSLERHVTYRTFYAESGRISIYDIATGVTRPNVVTGHLPALLDDGRAVGYLDGERGQLFASFRRGGWLDLETGAAAELTYDVELAPKDLTWSADGRFAAFFTRHPYRWPFDPPDTRPEEPYLFDRTLHGTFLLPAGTRLGPLDRAGRAIAFASPAASLVADDRNGVDDVFVLDLARYFDADADGLDDRWERTVGLDPARGADVDGPAGDPDGDGVSNADELARGTHPRGAATRFLAEGATGPFFDTQVALANPGAGEVSAVVRFSTDSGAQRWVWLRLPARSRRTVDAEALDGLESASFAVAIESDAPLVVDRRMSWGEGGYGAHAESSLPGALTTWFFAEGATGGGFDLFYLLQNPGDETADAEIRFLRPFGVAPIVRTYRLPPRSRTTVYVDVAAPELAATDVSAAITSTRPIVAERAMYLSDTGMPFRGGHAAAGVGAPASDWFFAEGATGPFFELFLLLANPDVAAASATVTYTTDTGVVLAKTYALPPQSRTTIWVDDEVFAGRGRALADAAVSARVSATHPIVAERAMWWPGGQAWAEGHASAGVRAAAPRWALGDGGSGGRRRVQTFVLIANPGAVPATVAVTILSEETRSTPETITVIVPPESRYTVDIGAAFPGLSPLSASEQRFGVLVESAADTPIVVERAMYWDTGAGVWEAGTGAAGTPLP